MTEIYFYSGAVDKCYTACRLSEKGVQQGLKVIVYTLDTALIERIDKLLWTFSPTSFIPHSRVHDKLANVTPVILGHEIANIKHHDVLLNLHDQYPPSFDRFNRLIEIASIKPEDQTAARKRYRFYQENGYKIHHYKLNN
jgi:DNA polymerase III subunit chi